MTKLFKNSKSVLSVALALAVLAVSLFTGVVINTEAACASSEGTTLYWDGNTVTEPTKTDGDGNTLITSAAELAYITSNTVTGNYKVADGIAAIVLQGDTYAADIMALADYAATKAYFEDTAKITPAVWKNEGAFQGTFDGNGVTIYGMYSNGERGGLFGTVYESTVIKNVSVKNSYMNTTKSAGALVGCYTASSAYLSKKITSTNGNDYELGVLVNLAGSNRPSDYWSLVADIATGMLTFDKCVVSGCYISSDAGNSSNNSTGAGVWLGTGWMCLNLTASNMLVHDNQALANNIEQGITGQISTKHTIPTSNNPLNNTDIKNCIILDCVPYTVYDPNDGSTAEDNNQAYNPQDFTNIYTNTDITFNPCTNSGGVDRYNGVFNRIDADDLKGAAAQSIVDKFNTANSEIVWLINPNGYPELRVAHKKAVLTDNHDGTHSVACECGVYSVPAQHNFVDGFCECGAEFNCAAKKTIYWDGTKAAKFYADTDGASADNPIIINTAEQLAFVATATRADTNGKYFKIADDIGKIVLQSETYGDDIIALDSAEAVKNYFEPIVASDVASKKNTLKLWLGNTWNPATMCFSGNFDGNGVEIYGMYNTNKDVNTNYTHNSAGGLFCIAENATISNVAIKNSYTDIGASSAGWNFGLIASYVKDEDGSNKSGNNLYIDRCIIANNYINKQVNDDATQLVGVVCGSSEDNAVIMQNLLVYGNIAKGTTPTYANYDLPIIGGSVNSVIATEEYATAHPTWVNGDAQPRKETVLENSVVLGTPLLATNAAGTEIIKSTWCVLSAINDANNCFGNVYTDWDVNNITDVNNFKKDFFLANCGSVISASDAFSEAAADLNLDWSAWMVNVNGYPALRVAHDDVLSAVPYAEDNYAGHVEACSCGLASSLVKHDYDENYHCSVCEFTCDHRSNDHITMVPIEGDCLTATTVMGVCDCGFSRTAPAEAPGHNFTYNEEDPSDCQTHGTAAYNYCPNCDKKYAADADKMAAFDTALSDEDLKLPLGDHTHAVDDNGVPVYSVTDAGHQKICGVCSEAYGDVETHVGEPVDNGDGTHSITCTVAGCGYAEASAPHNFGDDNVCDTCTYTCTAHDYVDGETIELTMEQRYGENSEAYKDICYYVEQICSICGTKGENKPIAHTPGEWETPTMDRNFVPTCTGEGQHTEVLICTECFFEVDSKIVTDAKTGHSFKDVDAIEGTCTSTGTIAHKYCNACGNAFAADAADDEAYENALNQFDGSMDTPIDPENHVWVKYGKDADCENDGVVAHKFCSECGLFMVNDEETDVVFDYNKFMERDEQTYEPIGIGAKLEDNYNKIEAEAFADYIAENYADQGFELVAYPENTEDYEAMDAYYAARWEVENALYELDENWREAWGEYQMAAWAQAQVDAMYEYLLAEAEAAEIELVVPAKGHTLVKVDEVAATYDKEGTKAHYACECGKLYSDAEGKNEVTAESLVIAKLVKVEENKPSTDNEAEGDKSDKSPATGESVASVAAVAALMGAAFVLVRKARKA